MPKFFPILAMKLRFCNLRVLADTDKVIAPARAFLTGWHLHGFGIHPRLLPVHCLASSFSRLVSEWPLISYELKVFLRKDDNNQHQ